VIVDLLMKMDPGKYLILKDPNKPFVRIYSVPPTEFESEDEESDEEEDSSDNEGKPDD
jgi:translation initiation factor 3 subunit D